MHFFQINLCYVDSYQVTHADEIAIITTAPPPATDITQNHKGYDVPYQTSSSLENLKCVYLDTYDCHLLSTCLLSYSTEIV